MGIESSDLGRESEVGVATVGENYSSMIVNYWTETKLQMIVDTPSNFLSPSPYQAQKPKLNITCRCVNFDDYNPEFPFNV